MKGRFKRDIDEGTKAKVKYMEEEYLHVPTSPQEDGTIEANGLRKPNPVRSGVRSRGVQLQTRVDRERTSEVTFEAASDYLRQVLRVCGSNDSCVTGNLELQMLSAGQKPTNANPLMDGESRLAEEEGHIELGEPADMDGIKVIDDTRVLSLGSQRTRVMPLYVKIMYTSVAVCVVWLSIMALGMYIRSPRKQITIDCSN